MTTRAALQVPVRQEAYRSDLIASLRAAMAPGVMLDALRRDWPYAERRDLKVVDCELARVLPQGAKGFVLEWEIELRGDPGDQVQTVLAELVGDAADAWAARVVRRLRKPFRGELPAEIPGDLVHSLPRLGLVLRLPGLDERFPSPMLIQNSKIAAEVLALNFDAPGADAGTASIDILGHRLGKRCVARLRYKGRRPGSIIAKMYKARTDRGREVFDAMEQLWATGFDRDSGVGIPKPLAYLPEWRAVLMEDVKGTLLPDLSGDALVAGTRAAGHALAKLHRCPLEVPGRHTVDDEIALLTGWVTLAGEVFPDLREGAGDALETVSEALHDCRDFEPSLVHRDFYEKQVLIDGARTVLIDFDTLCIGDSAQDLGNFLAHLRLAKLQETVDLEHLKEAFLAGYGAGVSAESNRRIETYTKSTLLRLACLYSFSTRWRHLSAPLLEGAQ